MAITQITTEILATSAVSTPKIADNAITAAKIPDGTIATGHIADNAVTAAKIPDNVLTATMLPDNVIAATHIPNATALTLDGGVTVDTITIDAGEIDQSSGNLTLDVDGDIIFDAGGNEILLKRQGTEWGQMFSTGAQFAIMSSVSDGDMIFYGNDGGSTVTALTLDMSDAGSATFNNSLTATTGTTTLGHTVIDAANVTMELKNGNDNKYIWRNLDSTNDLDLRYNSTSLMTYDSSATKWDWRGGHVAAETALVDGSTAVDANAANNYTLLLEENTTIGAPSNSTNGQIITIEVAQHGSSGPYTLAWNTAFEFAASTAPTMTATDAKTDIYTFKYNGTVWQEIGRVQNMAQT